MEQDKESYNQIIIKREGLIMRKNNKRITLGIIVGIMTCCMCHVAFAGDVTIDSNHFPDANFRELVRYRFDDNEDGVLSSDEVEGVTTLTCGSYAVGYDGKADGVTNLKGTEFFTDLEEIYWVTGELRSIDVRKNTKLKN